MEPSRVVPRTCVMGGGICVMLVFEMVTILIWTEILLAHLTYTARYCSLRGAKRRVLMRKSCLISRRRNLAVCIPCSHNTPCRVTDSDTILLLTLCLAVPYPCRSANASSTHTSSLGSYQTIPSPPELVVCINSTTDVWWEMQLS